MRRAYVGLGSNLDSPAERILEAQQRIDGLPQCRIEVASRRFVTPPWGFREQPAFVNAVVRIGTTLEPHAMLDALLAIELAMGRQRSVQWGPRRIDLDLLYMEGVTLRDERLELPHPRAAERGFVVLPWFDIEPEAELPGVGRLGELRFRVDCSGIEPLP